MLATLLIHSVQWQSGRKLKIRNKGMMDICFKKITLIAPEPSSKGLEKGQRGQLGLGCWLEERGHLIRGI